MVYRSVAARLDLAFEDLGAQSVKNIAKPVRGWRIGPGSAASAVSSREPPRSQFWPRLGVLVFAAIVVAVLAITGAAIWNTYLPRPAPADEVAPKTGMALPLPDKSSIAQNSTFKYKRRTVRQASAPLSQSSAASTVATLTPGSGGGLRIMMTGSDSSRAAMILG